MPEGNQGGAIPRKPHNLWVLNIVRYWNIEIPPYNEVNCDYAVFSKDEVLNSTWWSCMFGFLL